MTNIFKRLHTFTQPEVSVYVSIYEGDQGNGVDLYFVKGNRCKNMILSEHYVRWSTYFLS